MRAIVVEESKKDSPNALHIGEVEDPKPQKHQTLVRIKAFGLNRMDIMQRKGRYPVPPGVSEILGVEFSGIVEKDSDKWKAGQEVFGLAPGGAYAELIACPSCLLLKKPSSLSWAEAAAIPENWLTAFQCAIQITEVGPGKTVLIHAGASGVGTSAIQLSRLFGAKAVYTTAGTAEKCEFLTKHLKATKAFNYKTEDWSKGVLEATDGKGVDIILDFVGPDYWEKNIAAVARDGFILLIGLLSGAKTHEPLDMSAILYKRIRVQGTALRSRSLEYQTSLVQRFAKEAFPKMLDREELDLVIHKIFKAEQIVEATECMESASNIGKLICEW